MTANDSKSCLGYFNKLVDENNNSYHHPIGTKPIDVDCSAFYKEFELNLIAFIFKVSNRGRAMKYKNIFNKG